MKNRTLAVWMTAMMLSGAVAWGQGMAPVNPAFARWQREKAAKAGQQGEEEPSKKARGPRSPAARGEAGGEEMDFGFVPTVLDMGYLSNLNDNLTQGVGDELPSSFDLRESGAVTGVKDQGSYGNCWAFAALGSLESWVKKSEGVELDFSENHLANRHGWNSKFGGGGNAQMAEGYLLRWAGPVAESEDPYPASGASPSGTVLRHAQRVRWIPGRTGYLDNDGIKSALMAWGALMADYYHANGYYNAKKASYYFNAGTSFRMSNHSVLLVGWDDGYSRKNFSPEPPGDGAFIARNSWGSGWGDGGYFRVSYYDESFAWGPLYSFSSAEPADNFDGVYQHDPLGMVGAIGYGGPSAWGANIFTATNASKVAAAGFYAMTPRTTYTLKVYTGCAAGQPTSGTLAAEQSGTVDAAGYATVPISPVSVSAGQRFSVVVQLTTPGYAYPLAVEYAVAGYTPGATAGAGESFLSANGSSWNDFTKRVNSTANFCCKAYVKAGTAAKKLSGIAIDGVNSLDAGASAAFKCTASYSDGSTKAVSPKWSISEGSAWASVDASGTVTAKATDEQRTATVKAAYSEGGVSATATWKLLVTVAAPGAPTDLTASAGTEESCVRLSWTASAGASSYAVYRGTKESSGKAGYLGTVTVTRYADTAAVPGVDYRYFVKAKNGSGSSAFSEGAWGWRALAAPTELAASDGSREDRVDVTWDRSEGANHYRVWRAEGNEDFEAVSGWQTACQFADEMADIGTVYTYAVTAALDADGTRESAFSVSDEGFRTGPKTLKAVEIAGPVSLGSGARGTYSCTAVYTDGTRMQVTPKWSLTGGTLSVSGANAVVTAPAASENTTATLKADYTDGVTRSASLTIMVTPAVPAAPTGLAVASADGNGITLKWNAVANASSYQLWRATADEESAVIASTTATRHTDATAVPGVAYTYRVAAANGAGAGAPCAAGVTATRPIAAPTGVSASYGTFADKVLVTWRACEGAAFYRVWRAESAEGEKTALGEWQAGLSFEDTSAEAGTVYYYSVQAAADAVGTAASAFGGPAAGLRKVAPKPVALSIVGPERVAAESTAAYTAKVRYENGSTQTVVPVWYLASGNGFASIGSDGLLTVGALTEDQTVTIGARFTDGATVEASLEVALVAPIIKTATVSDVAAHARWPWNGWVDVDYNLETSPTGTVAKIILSGYDLDHKSALAATTLTGDGANGYTVEAGQRRISWNLGADYPGFHASQVRVSLNAVASEPVEPEPEDNSLAEGLVAWYAFDGDAKDSSGNGNHGTVNGATLTSDRNGKANGAYYFDGNDTIEVTDNALLRSVTNAFTIATWMKYDEIYYNESGHDWVPILSKSYGNTTLQFGLSMRPSSPSGTQVGGNGSEIIWATFNRFPPQNQWVHVAVTFDSNGVVTAYVNGSEAGTLQNYLMPQQNTENLFIGCDPGGEVEYLYGSLDNLGIWSRALTAEEVARLYAGERPIEENPTAKYLVVDLSGGPEAETWPVEYLDGEPEGGFNTDEYKTTKLVLRRIEAGTFMMGSPTDESGRETNETQHKVTLSKPYYIGLFEVTQKQYSLVMGSNPSNYSGDKRPVEKMSWNTIRGNTNWPASTAVSASSFMGRLRARTGLEFDLPTEAQWEYACRAGTTTAYSYGASASGDYMWYTSNSSSQTHEVGTKKPNPWGLYDMHGNVWEWCLDWYASSLGTAAMTDPKGASSGSDRVRRGGSWYYNAAYCRSAYRYGSNPSLTYDGLGFRLMCPVAQYLVVDLSGGPEAETWPVEYLDGEPVGGFNTDEYKTTKLVLRRIEGGAFMMRGKYQTTLTKPYYMGVFEVTQKQYELVTRSKPSNFSGDKRPVEQVSWNTIRGYSDTHNWPNSAAVHPNSFMGRLQKRTGLEFDLPTEAQWEYACRAGTTSDYNNGGNSEDDLKQLGRYMDNRSDDKGGYSDGHTTVGSYLPNAWGLYDMHGNVSEWCLDWHVGLTSGLTDPVGSFSGSGRVGRGGGWNCIADYCASSYCGGYIPEHADYSLGFRLVRTLSK